MVTHVEIALAAGYKTGIGKLQLLKNPHLCAALLQAKGLAWYWRATLCYPTFFLGFYGR